MRAHPACSLTRRLVRGLSALTIIVFSAGLLPALAADGGLRLRASVDKAQYGLGEPVYLSVILRNDGTAPVNLPEALNPQFGNIGIRITDAQGQVSNFVPLSVVDSDTLPTPLAPGQARAEVFPIFFGGGGWTFMKPGKYRIETRYALAGGKDVAAEPIALEVLPDAAGEMLIAPGRASNEAGRFLVWQAGDHLRAGTALLEGLLEKHPQSALANYVNFAFGKSQTRFFRDYPAEKLRAPDYQKAMQYFSKVNPAALPPYLRVQYEISHVRVDLAVGKAESAKSRLVEIDKMIKERPELHQLHEPAQRVEREVSAKGAR